VTAQQARRAILIATGGGFIGFYLELSAVPVAAAHDHGKGAAGVLTFSLLLGTVATQAGVPWLSRRVDLRRLLAAGIVLLGAPTLAYAAAHSLPAVVAVTVVRGVGFGLLTVLGAVLTAAYSGDQAQGRAMGLYGLVTSASATVAPAIGVAMHDRFPALIAAATGAAAPLVGALALTRPFPPPVERPAPPAIGERARTPARTVYLVVAFLPVVAAIGAAFSYLPLLDVGPVWLLLVAFGGGFALGRVLPGRSLDRGRSPQALLLGQIALCAVSLVAIGLHAEVSVAVGAPALGLAVGAISTTTLVMMVDGAGPTGVARASMIWNMTFDAGMGTGALALAGVAATLGPPAVFTAAAGLVACVAIPAAVADWARGRRAVPRTPARPSA
jgi:predicted MFS family arabinose efflux permease